MTVADRTGMDADELKADEEAAGEEDQVRKRPSVTMYLPEDVYYALDDLKHDLNRELREKRGKGLKVNAELYPALLRTALDHLNEIRNYLDLEAE